MKLNSSDDDADDYYVMIDCYSGVQYGLRWYGNDCLGSRLRIKEIAFHRVDAMNEYHRSISS